MGFRDNQQREREFLLHFFIKKVKFVLVSPKIAPMFGAKIKYMDSYDLFIETKRKTHTKSGFVVTDNDLHPMLFPFQRFIVKRALEVGKYAIFADCGLGKTFMQLEWAKHVVNHTDKPVLILAPLAVSGQTIEEGNVHFGIPVHQWRGDDAALSIDHHGGIPRIWITNYEQLANIDASIFSGVVLDESSIIKSFDGKTKKRIIHAFKRTPYKLACTATPSPNDPTELGSHAEFLDIMNSNEMLAMYFINDAAKTGTWRLKGHGVGRFYEFVSTWAMMLNNPKEIGFPMEGYDLPKLNLVERQIKTPKRENGKLFNDVAVSATNFNAELRLTKLERLEQVVDIVRAKPNDNFIIWIKQNEEGDWLKRQLPEAVEVKGSDTKEWKESKLLGFAKNEFRILISKTKIASFGMNYQNCHNQIFASLDFSFEQLYQGIRRSYRFNQQHDVNIYLITTDTMANVIESIQRKQKQFIEMQDEMSKAMNANISGELGLKKRYDTEEVQNEWYTIRRGDCVRLIQDLPDESIGFSVFSPPFAELYCYSDSIEDMGNSKDYKEFLVQFSFLAKELFRVIKQGRNVAVHCMDLRIQKGKEGYRGLRDFSGMLLKAFEEVGFIYHSRITIWKDPVVQMQRTKAIELLHAQIKKDSTLSSVGDADYVLVFRKDGERNDPVINTGIPVDLWQKYASPVWMDIDQGNTLQGFRKAREDKDEKHICPLQLDVIERLIHLYSNEGDVILTPFMGIGSEIYKAVEMNRKGIGFELKKSYFHQAKINLRSVLDTKKQTSLF